MRWLAECSATALGEALQAVAPELSGYPLTVRAAAGDDGDLHGNNQVWDGDQLRLVVDFECIGAAEPEYELRGFPGPDLGPGVELLTATMRHYQQLTGRQLSRERVMAWHVRLALGDVLWRSEAGFPLADHRTPPQWVEDLPARFTALGIDPEV